MKRKVGVFFVALLLEGLIGGRTFRKQPYFVPLKLQTAFVFF